MIAPPPILGDRRRFFMSLILSAVISFLVSLSTCFGFFMISKKQKTEEKFIQPVAPAQPVISDAELETEEEITYAADHSSPIKDFTLDNFCTDDATFIDNMKSMLDNYSATNPVILRGPTGSGKTYLMRAFQNYLLEKDPLKKVCFISAEALTSEFVDSLKNKTNREFKEKFRNLDALFIDDFNYLRNRECTQEFLFYILAALLEKKAFVCIAFTTPASLKKGFFDNLITLIKGVQIDIPYPGPDAKRWKIFQTFEKSKCCINDDIVDYLAKRKIGLSELVGICQKIILMKDLEGKGCVNLKIEDIKDLLN